MFDCFAVAVGVVVEGVDSELELSVGVGWKEGERKGGWEMLFYGDCGHFTLGRRTFGPLNNKEQVLSCCTLRKSGSRASLA